MYLSWRSLYSCPHRQVSRNRWTLCQTVSCMQQLHTQYALHTCYYFHALSWCQRHPSNYRHLHTTISFAPCKGYKFILTQWGEQEYLQVLQLSYWLYIPTSERSCNLAAVQGASWDIHTLRIHYVHAAANLNSSYSKYAKVARMHYFCTIALQTPYARVSVALGAISVRLICLLCV